VHVAASWPPRHFKEPTQEPARTRGAPLPVEGALVCLKCSGCGDRSASAPDPQAVRAGLPDAEGLTTRVLTLTIGPSERSALMDDREIQAPYNKSTNRYPSTTSTTSTSRRSTRSWASTSPEQGLECLARDESRAAGFVHRPGSHKSRTSRHPLRTAGFQQNELFHI
jgi:hypothetical protein